MDLKKAHKQSYELIKDLTFCVFDLETTGGNHRTDKIIEIGLVKIKNLEVVDEKDFLIKPEIKIPDFIQKLTSIKESDVVNAPLIEDVIDELLEFMGDSILVAHNTSFDIPFFNSVLKRLGRPELTNKNMCTNLMTKYLIPDLLNSNLNYMSKIFSIKHKKAHRALDDAKASAELLLNYLHIFISKDIQKINHLYYPRNRYELDRIHYKVDQHNNKTIIEKLKSITTPYILTLKGENGVILFSLPCKGTSIEMEYITEKLKEHSWLTTTIKLFGPYIEALVHFNNLFQKIDPQTRGEIFKFMWKQNLQGEKLPQKEDDIDQNTFLEKEFGDFVITNHIVPEQLIIYPIAALHVKNQLIFRYPSHKKKLLQYINSKSQRIANNKLKRSHFHPLLKAFVEKYIAREQNETLFTFKKSIPQKHSEDFFRRLDDYLAKNPNPNKYPKEYI